MSRNSKLYGDLKRRIDYLSAQYLPAPNPAGNYTRKQQDAIRTFLLLSHAELEYYFEESSRVIAKRALDRWLADHNYKSRVLLYLATFLDHTERIKQAETSEDKIKNIVGYYFVQIKDNNGIKRDNIFKLLCPLGVDQDQIDNSWLNTLDGYGSSRGVVAHTSAIVQTLKDPKDIRNDINRIIKDLSTLDLVIHRLS